VIGTHGLCFHATRSNICRFSVTQNAVVRLIGLLSSGASFNIRDDATLSVEATQVEAS